MAKKKSVEPLANIEAKDLDKTLVIDNEVYNINAVEADAAKKVYNKLTINEVGHESTVATVFDGSADKSVDIVPASGGKFEGRISVPAATREVLNADSTTVLNYQDTKDVLLSELLNNSVLYTWDGNEANDGSATGSIRSVGVIRGSDSDAVSFAQNNAVTKKFSAYIYIADNGNVYFGTSDSASLSKATVSSDSAEVAAKLKGTSNFRVNLASTSTAAFDGTQSSVTPGVTGTLPIANGGTGATTAATARSNLGITPGNIGAAASSHNHAATDINSGTLSSDRLPIVPVVKGGTGQTDLKNVTVGKADYATLAGSATNATNATNAKNAEYAATAGTANSATSATSASAASKADSIRASISNGSSTSGKYINIYISTSAPSSNTGAAGDICIVYS